eukprot:6334567-Amphidinium_carterae.1
MTSTNTHPAINRQTWVVPTAKVKVPSSAAKLPIWMRSKAGQKVVPATETALARRQAPRHLCGIGCCHPLYGKTLAQRMTTPLHTSFEGCLPNKLQSPFAEQ